MPNAVDFEFGGERLTASGDRTLWWPRTRTLFATDLHAGKAEHFRRYGSAIPTGSLEADLQRLSAAANNYGAERLIFLGDLFHSDINTEWQVFADWCGQQGFGIELVRGNHDRFLSDEMLGQANVAVHDEPYVLQPFELRHHPVTKPVAGQHVIAGHVHPVIWVGQAGDLMRLPCFWLQESQLILPAFGSLTGGYKINGLPRRAAYGCAPDLDSIIEIPAAG